MRWFRPGLGKRQLQHDPNRQHDLLHDVRHRFGAHVPVRFRDQADAAARVLDGDDGLCVAAEILRQFADSAHEDLLVQAADLHRRTGQAFTVDRRNYQTLGRAAGARVRWQLSALSGELHPYVQVAAAVTAVGAQARRCVRVTDPQPLLVHVFEVLDLVMAGWRYGGIQVDVDAALLADRLVSAARELRAAMAEAPPLPPAVRELMRTNTTIDIYDPAQQRLVGTISPGTLMRASLLA